MVKNKYKNIIEFKLAVAKKLGGTCRRLNLEREVNRSCGKMLQSVIS